MKASWPEGKLFVAIQLKGIWEKVTHGTFTQKSETKHHRSFPDPNHVVFVPKSKITTPMLSSNSQQLYRVWTVRPQMRKGSFCFGEGFGCLLCYRIQRKVRMQKHWHLTSRDENRLAELKCHVQILCIHDIAPRLCCITWLCLLQFWFEQTVITGFSDERMDISIDSHLLLPFWQ